jgi:protein-S-isoprenylcysteine O-methyltransferase Ste14
MADDTITKPDCSQCLTDSLGAVLIIMGAIAVVPSAMGVAQGSRDRYRSDREYAIYVVQSIILAFACLAIVAGIFVLVWQRGRASAAPTKLSV